MKKTMIVKALPALALTGLLALTIVALGQTNSSGAKRDKTDSPPPKHKQIRDLDEALIELENGEGDLTKALKEIDAEKIEREVRATLKNAHIDVAKMKEDVAKAMKDIDMVKINAEVQQSLKDLNTDELKREVANALASVDMDEMKAEMDKIKDVDLSKMKIEMENLKPQIEKSMQEAKKEIEKARKKVKAYKSLVDALDKDGLLNKKDPYKVDYKNGELTVNGKKLSTDDLKKYSEFLLNKKDFTLQKEADDFSIQQ